MSAAVRHGPSPLPTHASGRDRPPVGNRLPSRRRTNAAHLLPPAQLSIACLPVFFQPSGSSAQLVYGLMVCFLAFGAYVHFDPFEDSGNDGVARLCQVQQ